MGGAGINTGTVPSKTLRETALYFSGLGTRGLYGVDYTVKPNLTVRDFMHREREVVAALREKVEENLARHAGHPGPRRRPLRGPPHHPRPARGPAGSAAPGPVRPDRHRVPAAAGEGDPLRRPADPRQRHRAPHGPAAPAAGGHRHGRHRLRVRLDVRGARHRGDAVRAGQDPAGSSTARSPTACGARWSGSASASGWASTWPATSPPASRSASRCRRGTRSRWTRSWWRPAGWGTPTRWRSTGPASRPPRGGS